MSQGDDFSSDIEFSTIRGRDFPTICQFTVFLENRVGSLNGLIRKFQSSRVRVMALSINDSTECSIVRLILSHPEQGREILERAGVAMIESNLICVELNEVEQPLLEVCAALLRAEVNLVQTYPLMVQRCERTLVAIMVDNIEFAQQTLADEDFNMITEAELMDLS